jgi:ATP phosphoribosyltransferase regulatory subunit
VIRQPYWRLPEGVDDLLPPEARRLELLRRRVLDVFRVWGFEYVDPPLIEYLDSLLVGSGHDLDLQTLKVVDQRTGRLLGVRADLTSQAIRIDAHSRPADGVQRLCYAGCVVHANPAWALDDRVPQKAGAEIFGSDTLAADAEVIALLLAVLEAAGVSAPVLVLGHMGIYRGLVGGLSLTETEQRALFAAVQSKSESDIAELLGDRPGAEAMARLPSLMGGAEVLVRARACLTEANSDVTDSVDALAALAELVSERCPGVDLRFDLAELAGYGYHNGPVFSAYQADRGGGGGGGGGGGRGGGGVWGRARARRPLRRRGHCIRTRSECDRIRCQPEGAGAGQRCGGESRGAGDLGAVDWQRAAPSRAARGAGAAARSGRDRRIGGFPGRIAAGALRSRAGGLRQQLGGSAAKLTSEGAWVGTWW